MKAQYIFATIVAASVATAAAQSEAPTQQQKQQKQQKENAQTVTVTGCLQTGSSATTAPATAGEPATGQRGAGRDQFVLAQARVKGGATGTTETTGTAGTAGAVGSADKFRLIAGKPDELKKHLNHEVEISGTLQPRSERGQEKRTAVGDPQKPSVRADMPSLRVTGFKHIAANCDSIKR